MHYCLSLFCFIKTVLRFVINFSVNLIYSKHPEFYSLMHLLIYFDLFIKNVKFLNFVFLNLLFQYFKLFDLPNQNIFKIYCFS